MKIKVFKAWSEHKNTQHRVQPMSGIALDAYLIKLRVYHTPKPHLWQQVWGWKDGNK
ncbi:hypothetical protein [Lactiplantibacillus plantarum]|uniref:hypothetical protein n=1 Tax=Lactiplantibacillus plantarum TaxID=1590 RepID=UPI00265927E6|nr:hypothetical protein [Lactiplantibacillus plantarum]